MPRPCPGVLWFAGGNQQSWVRIQCSGDGLQSFERGRYLVVFEPRQIWLGNGGLGGQRVQRQAARLANLADSPADARHSAAPALIAAIGRLADVEHEIRRKVDL